MRTRNCGLKALVLLCVACLVCLGTAFTAQAAPWAVSTGFEAPDYVVGNLAGQQGWATSGTAVVENTQVNSGAQAAEVTSGSLAWLDVGATTDTIVRVQAFCKTSPVSEYPELPAPAGASCILCFHATDGLMCLDGDGVGSGTWRLASSGVTSWTLVTVRQDYTTHKWDIYVDGAPVLQNLNNAYNTTSFSKFECKAGGNGSMFLDEFRAGPESALPPDTPMNPVPANAAVAVAIDAPLHWNNAISPITTSYDLYFWTGATKPGTPTASGLTASDFQPAVALAFLTGYSWQVVANGPGGSVAGPVWGFITQPVPVTAAPANVVASDNTFTDKVAVTWGAVGGASHYQVYRADTLAGTKAIIAPWQATTTFDDTTAVPGVTYFYWVTAAVDAAGTYASVFSTPDTGVRSEAPIGQPYNYKVSYKGCTINPSGTYGLIVNVQPGAKAPSVKIQRLKNLPKSTVARPGSYYFLLNFPGFLGVEINGNMGKFYTDAPIRDLIENGALASLSTKMANVESITASGRIGAIKMASVQNGTGATPVFATLSIVSGGQSSESMSVGLTGIILENLATPQSLKVLSSSSKAYKSKTLGAGVAIGGIGRITATELAMPADSFQILSGGIKSLSSKGGSIAPDLLVASGDIGKIGASAGKGPAGPIGGLIGTNGTSITCTIIAPNMGSISGAMGIHGNFIAGAGAGNVPTFTGSIKSFSAKAGTLTGNVYLSPAAAAKLKVTGTSTMVIKSAP